MLGERRGQSLFVAEQPVEAVGEMAAPVTVEVVDEAPPVTPPPAKETPSPAEEKQHPKPEALRTHDLFFTPEDTAKDFGIVLRDVQEYISSKYSTLIVDGGRDDVKEQIKRYISKYVQDYRTMSLALQCVKAQIFIQTEFQNQIQAPCQEESQSAMTMA